MHELSINPAPKHFSMSQEELFVKELEDLDRYSVMWAITRPEDILLNNEAEIGTEQKFKLTNMALYQLCQNVCPGLYGFVRELSGVHRTIEEARGDYSIEESVHILNRVVKRRFASRLHGRVLLRNTKYGTIDGVITPGYKWLSNLRLYEMAKEAMRSCKQPTEFWEAQLNGRWLLLRFCNRQPYFSFDAPGGKERFYAGFHFSNDELGRATVRGAPFIMRKDSYTAALGDLEIKDRVRHVGASFEEKLLQLLNKTPTNLLPPGDYQDAILKLYDQSLGLGHKVQKDETQARRKLADALVRKDRPLTITRKIIATMCMQPSCVSPEVVEFRNTDRNRFDLFVAMGKEAKNLPIRIRESIEQLAYALLFNKVKLN